MAQSSPSTGARAVVVDAAGASATLESAESSASATGSGSATTTSTVSVPVQVEASVSTPRSASASASATTTSTTTSASASATAAIHPQGSATAGKMCFCGQPSTTREFMLECHYCQDWFHGACVQVTEHDALDIVKFACPSCTKRGNATTKVDVSAAVEVDPTYAPLPIQHRPPALTTDTTEPTQRTYQKNRKLFRQVLHAALYARSGLQVVASQDFTASYLKTHGLARPLLVKDSNWVISGLPQPLPIVSFQDISAMLAQEDCTVHSVNVETQQGIELTGTAWHKQLSDSPAEAPLNAQFRVFETALRQEVAVPMAVTQVDWHVMLPNAGGTSPKAPSPDIYGTLCGSNCFLDFTIAPEAKATWISVSSGELWVFLIEPTAANLTLFKEWKCATDPPPASVFLAERVAKCIRCCLKNATTLVIPSGWIHAVFAEQDSSYFSGYFATTHTLSTQLKVWMAMENDDQAVLRWKESSIAHAWEASTPLGYSVPSRAQLWSILCYYINQLSTMNGSLNVTQEEKEALIRALPYLHEWSHFPRCLDHTDSGAWVPASLQAANSLVTQLEQVLTRIPTNAASNSVGSMSLPEEKVVGISSLQPTDNSSYPYMGTDTWNISTASTEAMPTQPVYQSAPVVWNYASYEQPASVEPLVGVSAAFFPTQDAGSGQFSTSLTPQFAAMQAPIASYNGAYMDPMGSAAASQQLMALAGQTGFDMGNSSPYKDMAMRHRASCHRCGNLRKKNVPCPKCPHIFCQKCAEKMKEEHGEDIFVDGCPVCKELCCCGKNRTLACTRKFHCYKKCPSTKRAAP